MKPAITGTVCLSDHDDAGEGHGAKLLPAGSMVAHSRVSCARSGGPLKELMVDTGRTARSKRRELGMNWTIFDANELLRFREAAGTGTSTRA